MADKTWQNGEKVPADDFNRWEQSIAENSSDFSSKTFSDGDVPGTSEWNRIEQGILSIGNGIRENRLNNSDDPASYAGETAEYSTTTWSPSSDNNCTFEFLNLSNDGSISAKSGVRIINSGTGNVDIGQLLSGGSSIGGSQYRLECCARVLSSGEESTLLIRLYNVRSGNSFSGRFVISNTNWQRFGASVSLDETAGDYRARFGIAGAGNIDICDMTVLDYPAPGDVFTPNTIEDDTLIDADEANHIEQGIEDMINYAETYKDTSEADATPQIIPDDTEDDGNVTAPEAEEIG